MRIKTKLVQVTLITGLLIAQFIPCAHAWDNNYSQDNTYDSYSQNWQSYKQQNNINTQPAYQQSWWNSAINSIGNFFSGVTQAVTNFVTNVGNFFNNIVTSVQNFFVKTPDIKANQATAPPTKDINAEQTKAIDTGIDKSLSTKNNLSDTAQRDTYKTQATQKDNPYAYLTAEKACYDPRAAGLSQFSSDYQAIEAEYAARDKWVASQQTQQSDEGKLADTKPAEVLDSTKPLQGVDQQQQLNQKDISVIAPAQVTHPDPSIMPAENWETVKQTLPVNDAAQKQTTLQTETQSTLTDAAKFYGDKAQALGSDIKQFANDVRKNWGSSDSSLESGVKGTLEGFGREVKSEDLYTPVQKFFQDKSDQITNVTLAAMRGLDITGANISNEKGFFQVADSISIGAMKGCVVAGAVVAQTLADVGKFGSEIPQVMANAVLAKDAFQSGDLKQAWRYVGDALGGVGREAARATIFGSLVSNVENLFTSGSASKVATNFYVTPQGVSIPTTGYRYISADSPQLSSIINDGIVPANPKGTYITFDKMDDASTVSGLLQRPVNDLRYRVEFDTQQLSNDIKIPQSHFGAGDEPEAITSSFPEYGPGGVTQAITNNTIRVKRVVDLTNGEVICEF